MSLTRTSWPDWTGRDVVILASGESAAAIAPHLRRPDRRFLVLAVNLSIRLVPDADAIYAADSGFWAVYAQELDRFGGLKFAPGDQRVSRSRPGVRDVTIPRRDSGVRVDGPIKSPVGEIGSGGGNSAFQATNLAAQFGAARIYLGGVDFCGEHWHGRHDRRLRDPSPSQLAAWAAKFDAAAQVFGAFPVEIYNMSPISVLRSYPHVEAPDCLQYGPRSSRVPPPGG